MRIKLRIPFLFPLRHFVIPSSRMPLEPAKPRYLLTAQLLHPPVVFSGSLLECSLSVRLDTVQNDLTEPRCHVVGLVANVVGQYKVDQSLLKKHKLTAPGAVDLAVVSTSHTAADLWFDTKAVFASALEDNTNLLFCAPVSLDISEPRPTEQSFRLWTQLPSRLPPSVRGKLMKIAYKLLVAVQVKLGSRSSPRSHLLQIPFRLLPAPSMYQPVRALDMGPKPHLPPDIFHPSDNPFWTTTDQSEFAEFSRLFTVQPVGEATELSTTDSLHMVNAGQLRNTLLSLGVNHGNRPALSTKNRGRDFTWGSVYSGSKSACEESDQLMLGFDRPISATQPTNFMISCTRGFVVRFCLLRTLFRMDDTIRGFFDFSAAEVLCSKCQISLQSEERYSNYSAPSFVGAIPDDSVFEGTESTVAFTSQFLDEDGKTVFSSQDISDDCVRLSTWAEISLACLDHHLTPFNLPIPADATPQFCALSRPPSNLVIDSRWRLRLEFFIITDALSSTQAKYGTPATLNAVQTDRLAWSLPVQVVPSVLPTNVHAPPIIIQSGC
ncbi:hypothetical protein PHET_03098 [Paragonimus heterotremus]|uniref:RAB6A-GEF complex partner protein 2 n=1 Tax=Paragonimus heterotremus TaxID=100268 RepID=A0A8J4X1C9_9TREM|nr:hypothetical protein PHET_03098 [Paragonimus heterotremus]